MDRMIETTVWAVERVGQGKHLVIVLVEVLLYEVVVKNRFRMIEDRVFFD